jgi:nitrogen fixation/metabolism regulation signal transduction histidine kinase
MGSRYVPGGFAFAVAWRALLLGVLAFSVAHVLLNTQLYATALLLLLGIVLLIFDLARATATVDLTLVRYLERLGGDAAEAPTPDAVPGERLALAMRGAAARINARRADQQRRIDHLQGLVDTVSAALLVVRSGGRVVLANRAARRLAGEPVHRLDQMTALGSTLAQRLASLPPGARNLGRLASGEPVLISSAEMILTGDEPLRLISLQSISGELEPVEVKAWQDLARTLSHEMMNSLTPIVSLAESAAELVRDPAGAGLEAGAAAVEASEALDVIARRTSGLMRFVERYRLVGSLPPPRLERVQLLDLVAAVGRLMEPAFVARGVDYAHAVEPPDTLVVGDRELLEQALINLLQNAMEAVRAGAAPHVELLCRGQAGRVDLIVLDNGDGVPAELRDQIFVPFFSTKRGGAGVGLSLVRQIALAHGGQVKVGDAESGGAAFTLSLPTALQPAQALEPETDISAPSRVEALKGVS